MPTSTLSDVASRLGRRLLLALAAATALVVTLWAGDNLLHQGEVLRWVRVSGTDVSGLDAADLDRAIDGIAAGYADTEVVIRTDDSEVRTTAGVVGLELEPVATADNALRVGRGMVLGRPFSWLGALFGGRETPLALALGPGHPEELEAIVNAGQPEPVEPTFVLRDGAVDFNPGRTAAAFDLAGVRDDVLAAGAAGHVPIVVDARSVPRAPTLSDDAARAFVDAVNAATENGIEVRAGDRTAAFDAATLRRWLVFDTRGAEPRWLLDDLAVTDALEARLGGIGEVDGTAPDLVVVDGNVAIASITATCCAEDSTTRVLDALGDGDSIVTLGLRDRSGAEQQLLEDYGVVELVGQATTPYDCCQARVTNIQTFAALLQGHIIEPGASLSLNDAVGQRTAEKGFVEAGVIYSGELTSDVGGGISQFATTFFQASFYAGLDIDKYAPHTIWFARYVDYAGRAGIESTISWPRPDVVVTNNAPYPVLVWPTWTDTSLTVSLYSTAYATAQVAGQDISWDDQCKVIRTRRIRTFPDGSEKADTFVARYQPGNGIGCDGKPTNPDSSTPEPTGTAEPTTPAEQTPDQTATPAPEPTATATSG